MNTITLPAIPVDQILDALTMGEIDALTVKAWLKRTELALESIKEVCDSMAYDEAVKRGEKTFEYNGFKFEVVDYLSSTYQYEKSDHPAWNKWKKKMDDAKAELDAIQVQLRSMKAPQTIVDEETGEVHNVIPAPKVGRAGLKLTKINS